MTQVTGDFSELRYLQFQRFIFESVGSQAANAHVHWNGSTFKPSSTRRFAIALGQRSLVRPNTVSWWPTRLRSLVDYLLALA
jgi:hypothetical protein